MQDEQLNKDLDKQTLQLISEIRKQIDTGATNRTFDLIWELCDQIEIGKTSKEIAEFLKAFINR